MTPHLSVVLTAHDVEPYLGRCLESVLGHPGDVQVVVVDDGSTDRTAAIVESHADVELVRNPTAMGPGLARNIGLAHARGTYVWFVDGDDWLLDGAVDAVLERLVTEPDVLVVDHVRHYPNERIAPSSSHELLVAAPEQPFDLAAWPNLVRVLHVPWNKVVRHALLDEHGIRFSSARVYEDVGFTYRVLRVARRVEVLTTPCYAYRTARPGALTRTSGRTHDVWADEWDALLRDVADDPLVIRRALFAQMLRHGWSVFGVQNGWRVRGRQRPAFFHRFAAVHDARRPDGAKRDRVLALGWWPVGEVRMLADALSWATGRVMARLRPS